MDSLFQSPIFLGPSYPEEFPLLALPLLPSCHRLLSPCCTTCTGVNSCEPNRTDKLNATRARSFRDRGVLFGVLRGQRPLSRFATLIGILSHGLRWCKKRIERLRLRDSGNHDKQRFRIRLDVTINIDHICLIGIQYRIGGERMRLSIGRMVT